MKSKTFWAAAGKALTAVTAILIMIIVSAPGAWAGSYKVLHRFYQTRHHQDGTAPMGVVIFDPAGNLYGTASAGWGSGCYWRGCGNVFELTPNGDGTWTETVLSGGFFNTDPGAWPITLIFDGAGNLYGTAVGDYSCCGQVFQ